MRYKSYILSCILLLCFFSPISILSQDTSISKYLPLQVGNVWVYNYYASGYGYCNGAGYDKYIVTGTVQSNGKTYYVLQHSQIISYGSFVAGLPWVFNPLRPVRIDSVLGNVYKDDTCGSSQESIADSLKARLHDSISVCNTYCGHGKAVCSDTSAYNIFGQYRPSKSFGAGTESVCGSVYVKGIGVVQSGFWFPGPCNCQTNLIGCVINGVLYGDTTFPLGINKISSEVPKSFSLSQNYPNPFNPSTKIKFSIAPPLGLPSPSRVFDLPGGEAEGVRLTIYDAIGREIATLLNEKLNPGTYEVEWDASNFSSGVYFYKLEAGDYIETKKMVLMK